MNLNMEKRRVIHLLITSDRKQCPPLSELRKEDQSVLLKWYVASCASKNYLVFKERVV